MTMTMDKEVLAKALGRVVTGVYVLTTASGEEQVGMIGSWVMQAGFEPPMLTVAVAPEREFMKVLQKSGRCVVNVLSESNSGLMGRFAKFKPDQFEGLDAYTNQHGLVIREAVSYLAAEVTQIVPAGDHSIVLLEVKEGELLNADLTPWSHLRKNGFSY